MTPTPSNSPFRIAIVTATLLVAGLSLLLYLNEDLRKVALDMFEETVDEEGNVVRRVKVDRPEPSPRQVREIAREREEKRREDLREQARKIRESVIEIAEGVEARLEALEDPGEWAGLAALALELRGESHVIFRQVRHTRIHHLPETLPTVRRLRDTADNHANEMRMIVLAEAVEPDTVGERLKEARAIVEDGVLLLDRVRNGIAGLEEGSWKEEMTGRIPGFEAFNEQAVEYLDILERMATGDVPGEIADSEPGEQAEDSRAADHEHFNALRERLPSEEELATLDTAELYKRIQDLAEVADELFAENLAAELSDFRKIPLEEAREQVHKPRTDTGPDLQEALGKNEPDGRDEFREFNQALDQAANAAERMARTAETRRDRVRGDAGEGQSQTADQLQSAMQQGRRAQAEITRAAQASQGAGNVADMRSVMGQAYGLSGQGGGSGGGTGHGGGHASTFGPGGGNGAGDREISMRRGEVFARAVPGRRLDMNSSRQGWIFLDTWYMIGPWQRPRVDSFETLFPPETDVDLDATYEGKLHPATREPIELKWRFVQSENVRINPPDETSDSVYYAYTELYSEVAMDVLLAIGADDASKVWINDLVVYQDNALSGWRPDEGFRRVLLKPGYNKVLVRLENGPSVTYFSVIVCPDDALEN
ncbi:MAG: hypothetical protein WD490_08005 [Opitutales bacterium]